MVTSQSREPNALELSFRATIAACRRTHSRLMEFITQSCDMAASEMEIDLSLEEALANARLHGCKGEATKLIYSKVNRMSDGVEIVGRDPGQGFEQAELPNPLSEEGQGRFSGRGVYLIRSLMDEVIFAANGAEIRMRMRRK